jgi:hypothetical protein
MIQIARSSSGKSTDEILDGLNKATEQFKNDAKMKFGK